MVGQFHGALYNTRSINIFGSLPRRPKSLHILASSSSHEAAKMINESLPVTFGMEFEAILAFHEALLRSHLQDTGNDSEIIKDIPDRTRGTLNQVDPSYQLERSKYMGWGLTKPTQYWDDQDSWRQEMFEDHLGNVGYRGYAGEILTLGKTLLPEGVQVHDSLARPYSDFQYWHLTHDNSLVGVSKDALADNLRKASQQTDEIENWDNHPLELVSRILPYSPSSFEEIDTHLARLAGTTEDQHTAFTTDCCGLHVHVGLPVPEGHDEDTSTPTFSLPTLQHLAYMLVMYEVSMRKLFPKWRREGSSTSQLDLQSNLDEFIPEPTYDDWDPEKDTFESLNAEEPAVDEGAAEDAGTAIGHDEDNDTGIAGDFAGMNISQEDQQTNEPNVSNDPPTAPMDPNPSPSTSSSSPSCPTIPFSEVRAKIFHPDTTFSSLSKLMGGTTKSRLVNWRNITDSKTSARTIEFRQHEGTLDREEVRMWVGFVVGLLRLAEENARVFGVGRWKDTEDGGSAWTGYEGEGYRWQEWSEELEVGELVEGMELEGGREWVERRVGMWE